MGSCSRGTFSKRQYSISYRLGMERLLHDDGCRIIETSDILRDVMKGEPEEELREIERSLKREVDMCMAGCRGQRFGAACLFNASFLQETAEKKGCDLLTIVRRFVFRIYTV